MTNIRVAELSEHPILAKIWEEAVISTHDFLSSEDFDYFKSQISNYLKNVELYVYVDKTDEEIGGFLGVSESSVEMLFVKTRGKGIGSALMKFAIEQLEINRVDVNQQNHKALDFYLKHGFEQSSISQLDGSGKPYPIVHLILPD